MSGRGKKKIKNQLGRTLQKQQNQKGRALGGVNESGEIVLGYLTDKSAQSKNESILDQSGMSLFDVRLFLLPY
jgi:hypothetical protein